MTQTKKQSLIESVTNVLIGMVISLIVQLIVYPIMDIEVKFIQNIYLTLIFTVVSIARSYIIRRFFNKKIGLHISEITIQKDGKTITKRNIEL